MYVQESSTYPAAVIRIANYPDRLGLSRKSVENSTKLTCLEITGYQITYNTVLMASNFISNVVERFRRRYILYIVTAELQTANVACFQRKIQLFAFSAYPDEWSSTVFDKLVSQDK